MKTPLGKELAPVSCTFLLRLFPFGIVINKEMRILGGGEKLLQAWGGSSSILNRHITEIFKLRRPKGISFTWGNVRRYTFHCTEFSTFLLFHDQQTRRNRSNKRQYYTNKTHLHFVFSVYCDISCIRRIHPIPYNITILYSNTFRVRSIAFVKFIVKLDFKNKVLVDSVIVCSIEYLNIFISIPGVYFPIITSVDPLLSR